MREDWIGLRVARWRDIAGMTQQGLADRIGVSREYVSMIENGKRAVTKRSLLYDLAAALGVSVTDLTGQPIPPRSAVERSAYIAAPAIRQALDGEAPVEPRSIAHLVDISDWAMAARMASDWATLARILPGLISETAVLAEEGEDRAIALQVQACVVAALAVKPLGYLDLSRVLSERAAAYARQLGDPIHAAAAQFAVAQAVLAGGSRQRSLAVAERAAEQLQPDATDDDGRTWYGMLHLHAALSAASVGQADNAATHLTEAAEMAQAVSSDPWRMEFSPANVGVWGVGVALENGEPGRAPELARHVDQTQLRTVDRRIRLHLDSARGLYLAGKHKAAVRALLIADEIAPQAIRTRSAVREIVGQMVRDSQRQGSDELRDLALRLGIDPLEPPDTPGAEPARNSD
jgi:transcriptional regulator with XRE-family HTH domain